MLADGFAFRYIEENWAHFKEEPRNVRISLADYGFNSYEEKRSIYLVWPIFIINNNIPPWLSIKRDHIMLVMIIPDMCLQQQQN